MVVLRPSGPADGAFFFVFLFLSFLFSLFLHTAEQEMTFGDSKAPQSWV